MHSRTKVIQVEESATLLARDSQVVRCVACVLSGATLLMIVSTWPLWSPQTDFPRVPLFRFALAAPAGWDELVTCGLVAALAAALLLAVCDRLSLMNRCLILAMSLFLLLFLTDQHRLQPWAYQFVVSSWVLAMCRKNSAAWLRALFVSLYLYSAISKIDVTFVQTTGRLFVDTASDLLHIEVPAKGSTVTSWALAACELVVGILLIPKRTRRIGVAAAVTVHAVLMVLLGPFGLSHHPAVLIWNLSFMLQVVCLFGRSFPPHAADSEDSEAPLPVASVDASPRRLHVITHWACAAPVLGAIVMPVFEPLGYWDPWLSWGLYSSRVAKVDLWIARPALPHVPPSIRPYLGAQESSELWVRFAAARWSLNSLRAPMYPQERFYLGVAVGVARKLPEPYRMVKFVRRSVPNRWTGSVEETHWQDLNEATKHADRFWFNALPLAED